MNATPLHVAVVLPPAPYTLAGQDFMSTLAEVEAEISSMVVTSPESAQKAADTQSRLTKAGSKLEAARKTLKQPFVDAGRAIDAAAEAPMSRIETAKNTVKRLLTQYDEAERIKAANAERARQAELARLAKIAADEKREADRKAQEAADALLAQAEAARAALPPDAEVVDMGFDDPAPEYPPEHYEELRKTETELAIERLQHAPVVQAPRPTGVTMRVTLVATVTDVRLLPEVFVERTAKLAAIRATYCSGWTEGKAIPECAGVKFEVSRGPVSTGR